MVTIKQLQKQIAAEEAKVAKAKKQQDLELEKLKLSRQLKVLKRSPGTKRNIALARRVGVGLKRFGSTASGALVKQAKLIREQQLREDAAFERSQKSLSTGSKKTSKKIGKGIKKKSRSVARKLKRKPRRR